MEDQMPDYKCITCGWEGFKGTKKAPELHFPI